MSDSANLPVIPDKVVDRIRAGKPVALEEVSSAAAEMRDTREAARSQPLHGGSLRPTTRSHANTLMTGNPQGHLQRGTVPRAPATRRVIPPPFQRESISIRVPGEPRPEWRTVRASQVQEGLIVPGVGRVVGTERRTRHSDAADQVPVFREEALMNAQIPALIPVQDYTGEDARRLLDAYGSTRVAVGVDIVLTGPEGASVTVDERAEVQAFGFFPGA